jgi:hypothetical protein
VFAETGRKRRIKWRGGGEREVEVRCWWKERNKICVTGKVGRHKGGLEEKEERDTGRNNDRSVERR